MDGIAFDWQIAAAVVCIAVVGWKVCTGVAGALAESLMGGGSNRRNVKTFTQQLADERREEARRQAARDRKFRQLAKKLGAAR